MPAPERPLAPATFHILIALADKPRHGYGIMQEVADRTAGKIVMSPGTCTDRSSRCSKRI